MARLCHEWRFPTTAERAAQNGTTLYIPIILWQIYLFNTCSHLNSDLPVLLCPFFNEKELLATFHSRKFSSRPSENCDNMCSTKPKAGPSPTSWHYLTLHSTNQPSSGYCGYPVSTIGLFPDKFFYYLILGSILPDSSSEKYMKLNSTCPVLYK